MSIGRRRGVTSATATLPPLPSIITPTPHPTAPVVVPDSDSDEVPSSSEESDAVEFDRLATTTFSDEESDVESWVRTPDGSPPRRSSRNYAIRLTASAPPDPDDPPPEYTEYLQPTVESFGFHPAIADFLRTRDLSPAGLVRIDSTLDYHVNDWDVGFLDAGLTPADAQELREIVIQSLSDPVREALITAWAVDDN